MVLVAFSIELDGSLEVKAEGSNANPAKEIISYAKMYGLELKECGIALPEGDYEEWGPIAAAADTWSQATLVKDQWIYFEVTPTFDNLRVHLLFLWKRLPRFASMLREKDSKIH